MIIVIIIIIFIAIALFTLCRHQRANFEMIGGKRISTMNTLTKQDIKHFFEEMSDDDKYLLGLDWAPKVKKLLRSKHCYGIPRKGFVWIDEPYIECLYVSPSYRLKGIANKLMKYALSQMSCECVYVKSKVANIAIEGLLKRHGFVQRFITNDVKEWIKCKSAHIKS